MSEQALVGALAFTNAVWFIYTLFLHGAYNEFKTHIIEELFNRLDGGDHDVSDRDR